MMHSNVEKSSEKAMLSREIGFGGAMASFFQIFRHATFSRVIGFGAFFPKKLGLRVSLLPSIDKYLQSNTCSKLEVSITFVCVCIERKVPQERSWIER